MNAWDVPAITHHALDGIFPSQFHVWPSIAPPPGDDA